MARNTKIVIGIAVVGAIFIGALLVMAMLRSASQTASATASVVSAEQERKRGNDDTILTLSYAVQGQPVQGRARVSGTVMDRYPAGTQVPVCYDPAKPTSVSVAEGPCSR